MSSTLAAALLIQLTALAVVLVPLRRRAIGLVGPAFVAIAVLYHGITELIQLASPFGNVYDPYASQALVDEWVWIVAVAILLVAVSYIVVLGRIGGDTAPESAVAQSSLMDWRILLIVAAPMYVVLITGQTSYEENYWLGGLSSQFFTLVLALASFDFIRRNGGRYVVPVLLGQSAALVLVGERYTVVVGTLLVVYALAWAGMSPSRRQVLLVFTVAILGAFIISSAREAGDRFGRGTSVDSTLRATALFEGAQRLTSSWNSEGLWSDWVYRFDGNTYPAMIARDLRAGREPAGATRMAETALLAVPNFAYSGKAALDITARNEETFLSTRYGLSTDRWAVDFLPTTLGVIYAYLGPFGLWGGAVVIGAAFALLDRWLRARRTTARLLTALGVLICVLSYEQGVEVYPVTLRGILVLVVLATAIRSAGLIFRRHSTSASRHPRVTTEPVGKAGSVPARPMTAP